MAPKKGVKNVSKLSARDVLENIGIGIYNKEKKKTETYESDLIGKLSKAEFADGLYRSIGWGVRYGYYDSCGLDHNYNTNIIHVYNDGRNPCHGREKNRFDENAEAYCNSDKIRVIGKKSDGTACVPFRRQNMCDRNLEYLINENTKTTHDLLGNVLVTAKYEGNYIVSNHPDKNSNGNKSRICTSLARSFADIGDIVRGKDMFKPNSDDKVEKGLQVVFGKIYKSLPLEAKNHYKDDNGSENYYKLREDWWAINRKEVWNALTCDAPRDADYFKNVAGNTQQFTDIGKCGHKQGNVPTNLDYVPQFLRWYDEWAEDFCRINKIKIDKVKGECGGENENKYCSVDGDDCKEDIQKNKNVITDLSCRNCANACNEYKQWMEKQEKQFNKQKKKYMKQNENFKSIYDSEYYKNEKQFYENLKNSYSTVTSFLDLLNKSNQCENMDKRNETDFNSPEKTFSTLDYCKGCPIYGVNCETGKCISVSEEEWKKKNDFNGKNEKDKNPTYIDILVNERTKNSIENDLRKNCKKSGLFKDSSIQKYKCEYLNEIDQCKMSSQNIYVYADERITFKVLFKRWLKYFVQDYNKAKSKIDECTKNENLCIKDCNDYCECLEKWIEKRSNEWEKIKEHYKKHFGKGGPNFYYLTRSYLENLNLKSDIINAARNVKDLNHLEDLERCKSHTNCENDLSNKNDAITVLLGLLKEKFKTCKIQHNYRTNQICCDELPESTEDDEDEEEEGKKKKKLKDLEATKEKKELDDKKFLDLCEEVKEYIKHNNTQKSIQQKCNTKGDGNWNDSTTKIDRNHIGAHMPPRRKSLCIRELRYLFENGGNKKIDDYQKAFVKCASIETYLLWQKYKTSNGAEDKLKGGKIPNDFLRIMYYTFGDYRDIFLGTDISSDIIIKTISNKVKTILQKQNKDGKENIENIQKIWWEEHKRTIWKGMLCGLTYGISNEQQKKNIRKMLNNKYKYPCDLETFSKKPQFLRWLEEWYDDFCKEKQQLCKRVDESCMENKDTYNCSNCVEDCGKYETFLSKKKEEWNKQKQYYENKKNNNKGNQFTYKYFTQENAIDYLKDAFSSNIDDTYKTGMINMEKILFDNSYGDMKDKCSCIKYDNEEIYKNVVGKNNCEGLKSDADKGSIKWINKGNGYKYLKDLTQEIYFPPRRQRICIGGLDDGNRVNDEKTLRKHVMDRFAAEGYNLGQYYKEKNKLQADQNRYTYDVDICNALRYSFYDLRDIILGTDILEPENTETGKKIKKVFEDKLKKRGKKDNSSIRQKFWNENKECFWKAMKCGYQKGRDNGEIERNISIDKDLEVCDTVPPYSDSPIGTIRKEGMNRQFLRWFKEWSEDFCERRKHEVKKLENACENYNCNANDYNQKENACQEACKNYRTFVTNWKYEYQQQKKEYDKVKSTLGEKDDAHIYLKKKCNSKCSCIDELSKQSLSLDIPAAFDHPPKEVPDKCPCPDPPYKPSKINYTTKTSYEPNLPSFATVDTDGVQRNSIKNDLEDESSDKNKTLNFLMNCVEKSAYESMEYIEKGIKNVKDKLRGNNLNLIDNCDKVDNVISCENGYKIIDEKKLNDEYKVNNACPKDANTRFEIGKLWLCDKINKKDHHICLPPRRQHMCIKKIESMFRNDVQKSDDLLKIVIEEARKEGIQILKSLNFTSKDEYYKICDAMKYSFADIGDIIRGYDLWNKDPTQERIQTRLGNIFRNIYGTLDKEVQKKYMDPPYYYKLREDWWSANRKDIWKAMTCAAPEKAYFTKKAPDGSGLQDIIRQFKKCSRDKDPPVDDYIPQRLRWMQEWSEYFCEVLNKEMLEMHYKCETCIQETSCVDDNDGNKCTNCKEQCKKYKELVNKWKLQFDKQSTKYEELYLKTSDDIFTKEWSTMRDFKDNNKHAGIFINRRRNSKKPIVTYNERNVVQFLKKVKQQKNCSVKTANAYLHKTSNCKNFDFNNINTISHKKYAFEIPPEGYDKACKCIGPEPLDRCPDNDTTSNYCNGFVSVSECTTKKYKDDLDYWNNTSVKYSTGINYGVLVPPRRRHICFTNMITKQYEKQKNGMENFKTDLLQVAYNEGYFLGKKKYDKEYRSALEAIKYTFADIADIVKGKDMINKDISTKLRKLLDNNIKSKTPRIWWKYNKAHVWHAMLCGYKNGGGTITNLDCTIPNEEFTDQFLRWFQEWTQTFCTARQILYDDVQTQCNNVSCDNDTGNIESKCTEACKNYSNFILVKKNVYQSLKSQYDINYKERIVGNIEAHEYLKDKCKDRKCECFSNHTNNENNWKEPYDTFVDKKLKDKCDCKKIEKTFPEEATEVEKKEPPSSGETLPPYPLPNDQPDVNGKILSTTIPFGIALALGSIAFMFIKKKPKSPVDLLRVLDIHKGDYGIPTPKSSNRYIPYVSDTYKGKTYIYMEGDTRGDDDKYAFMSDTTDVTSSESEYEEMDINDIYVPDSPKYKTLIEVVLEPSGKNTTASGNNTTASGNNTTASGNNTTASGNNTTASDTQNDIQNDGIPSSKITDNEWNQLKHEFISQYLQSEQPKDVPNDYTSGDIPLNTQPNTLYFDKPEEKPFITSIHDRNLYTGEEYSYDMSTNSMDDPKYVSNNVYSGIDLINDSLSGEPINIYDEVLKRKENELFGTNHPKHTNTHSVTKPARDDPLHNQLELFHKWLDRHRDMCEKWNTKEELLDKLNEQWNKDNDGNNVPIDNISLNTDVSIQIDIDETKGKKEFTNMDTNVDTPTMDNMLDDLETYNEPFYDIYDDDVYYDVNDDENASVDNIPMDHNKVDVPKKVHVEMKILNNTSNGSLEPEFPISDVWNI
ncbi:hypothetical protein PFMALIP_05832 [Plasmodium falciparum MaliPS096_E11]|uniref:Erythrocyte membrane protein 1, PfEMP1 n=2 Tax=Plasmodium falciparum TaxID=5833 RepID=A0A024WGJ6_PLAFA|nr:hypothetical protein PFMALIP_05832 [Plasmodium falciparum MaliPS096_E11]